MQCKNCGEWMAGDGYTVVRHCPGACDDLVDCAEPDAPAIYCSWAEQDQRDEEDEMDWHPGHPSNYGDN